MRIVNTTNIVSKEKLQESLELIPYRLKEVQLAVDRVINAYQAEQSRRNPEPVAKIIKEPVEATRAYVATTSLEISNQTKSNGQLNEELIRASIGVIYEDQQKVA